MSSPTPPNDPGSRRRAAPVTGGADRYEALLEVLEKQAEQAKERGGRPPEQGGSSRLKIGLLVVLLAVTAWLWIMPPAWLVPPPPPPQPIQQEEAALRFTMYLQAQRVRAYQLEHGSLPETLAEAGQAIPGVDYVLLGPGLYELTGSTDRLRLTYRSDEPLRDWMNTGATAVDDAGAP